MIEQTLSIDVIIAGAQKSGTSSLKYYLSQHPEVVTHPQKEFTPVIYKNDFIENFTIYFNDFFPRNNHLLKKIILAKSVTVMSSERYIRLLVEHNPQIKIILVLRHPVERAYSAYWYARRMGWEKEESFRNAIKKKKIHNMKIDSNNLDYISPGYYFEKITSIYKFIPPKRVFIYTFDQLISSTLKTCSTIFKNLNIDDSFEPDVKTSKNQLAASRFPILSKFLTMPRKSGVKKYIPRGLHPLIDETKSTFIKLNEKKHTVPVLDDETRMILIDHFRPHNKKLQNLLNYNISSWNE